jgi:hypothetical protein
MMYAARVNGFSILYSNSADAPSSSSTLGIYHRRDCRLEELLMQLQQNHCLNHVLYSLLSIRHTAHLQRKSLYSKTLYRQSTWKTIKKSLAARTRALNSASNALLKTPSFNQYPHCTESVSRVYRPYKTLWDEVHTGCQEKVTIDLRGKTSSLVMENWGRFVQAQLRGYQVTISWLFSSSRLLSLS